MLPMQISGRQRWFFSVCLFFLIQFSAILIAYGQSDTHTATINVQEIAWLQISGSVSITITGTGVVAGQDLMTATDQSSTLSWGLNGTSKKITVRTNIGTPLYTLTVQALNPIPGSSAGVVTVSTTDLNLILSLSRNKGSSTLRYTAAALASQGIGSDIHTITFTVTTQ